MHYFILHMRFSSSSARKPDGTWSPPSALGLGGIGCGLMAGAEVKDIIVCVLDEEDLKAISSERQFKIGGQVSAEI